MKVAVIGGGWAGLAAAVELTDAGCAVTLFEAGRVLGGRARSVALADQTLDNGQHILLGAYRETLALMRRLGADPAELFTRTPLQVCDNTGFQLTLPRLPAPLNVAIGLGCAKGVGWQEKLKTALWMQGIKWRAFRLPKESTVAEWLDRAGQMGVLRRHLWEPLCLAALNTPSERASAQLFANVLRDSLGSPHREATDLLLPRVPFGRLLPEPAAEWLTRHGAKLTLGHRVRQLEANPDRIAIDGESFAAAIIAVAPQHLAGLWPGIDVPSDFEPIATIYLQYADSVRQDYPLQNRLGQYGQWVVDRGAGLLACVLSGHGDWEALDDQALIQALHDELGYSQAPRWHRVIREKRATFSCHPHVPRPACRTDHPRVFLAGDYTWAEYPATLEGAVRSGLRAAQHLSDQLS